MSFVLVLSVMQDFLPFYCGFYFYKVQGLDLMIKVRMGFFNSDNVTIFAITVTGYCLLNSRLNVE